MLIGELQENAGDTTEALRTYQSTLPHVASTIQTFHSVPEHRKWTERLLVRCCILSNAIAKSAVDKGHKTLNTRATLAPFRSWAELWASTSRFRSGSGPGNSNMLEPASRRRVWQLYYETLSAILQKGTTYSVADRGPSVSTTEVFNDNVKSIENPKLEQSIELRRVEGIYEEILLSEVSFPKANEANVEVESWVDQVMANWRVISSPAWQSEDLGKGGKEAATRSILAVCCTCLRIRCSVAHASLVERETYTGWSRYSTEPLLVLFTPLEYCAICSTYIPHWLSLPLRQRPSIPTSSW